MPKISANLGFLWPELDLCDRIYAAKDAGFDAVECHWPFDVDAVKVASALSATGLTMLSLNTAIAGEGAGEYGFGAVPNHEECARETIDEAVEYARTIGSKNIHLMAGTSGDGDESIKAYLANLRYASVQAEKHSIGVIIEPINRFDRPGYTLHSIDQALIILGALHSNGENKNVGLMFDCYHVQTTEGGLTRRIQQALPHVIHIQIASVPDRHEPDRGEIDLFWLLRWLDEIGYSGFVGAEYIPETTTNAGLSWLARVKR
ncbi:MAG: TIM barrel protein [Pseudomonadota bacterium]